MGAPAWARGAMVSTSSPHAVQAGLWALAQGGTAVDAAIAADAVLGLAQPMSTGVGGDAFAIVDDGSGELAGFNGSGAAPAALTLDRCRQPGAWHETSPLSVTVPGAVDAWARLSERYGRLGLAACLTPARRLAADGFPIGNRTASVWSANSHKLRPGGPWPATVAAGQRFANPALAATLDAIAAGGPEAHYTGDFAKAAMEAVAAEGGVLSLDDLAGHAGEWVAPITGAYRDHEIVELPPNGQGAAVLAALAILDRETPGPRRVPGIAATMLAIRDGMRAAYRHVADPRLAEVPPFWQAGRDTVYTAVVAGGMAVSLISSVYAGFGSGLHAGGSALQNRGLGFRLTEGHPNVVAGGKRPFHTIIPGLARDARGRTALVFGVVGGPMQPQGHVQVLSHLIDGGLDPQAALDRPRAQWFGGDLVGFEPGLPASTGPALVEAGFQLAPGPMDVENFGVGQVIRVHDDGWLEGGSDPRHDGQAVGFSP
jgi:gamma-glutamyltranspeptidase / glutathione hydrolase